MNFIQYVWYCNSLFLASQIFESLSLSFILIFHKRLSLQKDIIEAKMTTVAAKQIKAEAEERVKKTAKLSEAVLNKECVYPFLVI